MVGDLRERSGQELKQRAKSGAYPALDSSRAEQLDRDPAQIEDDESE